MARLLIKTASIENRLIELRLGVNRLGRSADADFSIPHPTVSGFHCELELTEEGVLLRDLESTNGTFVDGKPVRSAKLSAGQMVRLGQVELYVENTDLKVAIPQFVDMDLPAPPVVLPDGRLICPRHPHAQATHHCTVCKEVMCEGCVHQLRRKGSKRLLLLCPVCSNPVEPICEVEKPKRKSLLARVSETVRMKLTRAIQLSNNRR